MPTKPDTEREPDTAKPKPPRRPKGPWPDPEAREQMSREEAERENLGKHGKNPGWEKTW